VCGKGVPANPWELARNKITLDTMAYDENLAARIRDLSAGTADVREQKMFGGLAFLVRGNMAMAASGQGGLLARVDPDEGDRLLDGDRVTLMSIGGRRPMRGWLRVSAEMVSDDAALREWVDRAVAYAASLPPKG